ncbi:MAG: sulfurtransferase, partial [Alphaproteobacteria bacterium]
MTKTVDAKTLKAMLRDGRELALIDVREEGQFGEAHMLYATPHPYSVLERGLDRLIPRRTVRTELVDGADGDADR